MCVNFASQDLCGMPAEWPVPIATDTPALGELASDCWALTQPGHVLQARQ